MAPHMSGVVPVQLVVNIVAVVTAAVGAVALQESPLTAVQMVRPTWPALWPSTALAPRPVASRWYRPCILPKQAAASESQTYVPVDRALLRHVRENDESE